MKFLKNRKFDLLLIFSLLIFCSVFIFSPFSFEKLAQAFSGNYDRTSDDTIDLDDWNWLDDDFLLRDGSNTMEGDLDMAGNRVINVDTPVNNTDGATVGYVEDAIIAAASAGGGDVFVNWGNDECPSGTNELYDGYVFSAPYNATAGGANPICIESPNDPEFPNTNLDHSDQLLPLVTATNPDNLPTSGVDPLSGIRESSYVSCALCHVSNGICYERIGGHDCATNFNAVYEGYMHGSYSTNGGDSHYNSTLRECLNRDFTYTNSFGNLGAIWYGTKIDQNFGLTMMTNAFIKCSLCCNN